MADQFAMFYCPGGRKHQIRRHCAVIGHPVVGDSVYGKADATGLQLRAVLLAFECPLTRQRQQFALIDKPAWPA